ncbi:MAG: Acetyl-CoA decarbonylase/synthase complex subunit beta 2 [Methanomassiliicoccales archaeon PtaU1.Bin124]|nr:MAG: Acetyl-CoA decarbonylase/synthase complex subunit beta 2 [Methanomassiliicoccales archaeon PtaU1.Bin124]
MSEEKSSPERTCDPGAQSCMDIAVLTNMETAWDRFEQMQPQCGYGELGICCNNCLQGPCRINPYGGKPDKGICGARDYTIVARNLIRHIAGGAAAHSGHGRHIADTVQKALDGKSSSYRVKDELKLRAVLQRLGEQTEGRSKDDMARTLLNYVYEDYSRHDKVGPSFLSSTITPARLALFKALGLVPESIEKSISDVMHRTSLGCDADPLPLLFGGISCALADYDGMQISTDLSDVLFGTPRLVHTYANLGAIKPDAVNIAIHGHNPVLSDIIVDVARSLEDEAREVGASGINIVGICCTGNETLMRKGVALASNFAAQELALATGAVDLIVADYQCIMPSLSELCSCMHTEMVTTMTNVRLPYDTHVQFREEEAEESAKAIIRLAINAYKKREKAKVKVPDVKYDVVAGFSLEQIKDLCAKLSPVDPLQFIVKALSSGQIKGIALMAGCNNQRAVHDINHIMIAKALLAKDILILTTGCSAGAFAKQGMLAPSAVELAGPGLRSFLKELGEANAVALPPIWHMGSCVDNSRAANLATELAKRLGTDISGIPFAASAPEANHEKAVSIGTWCVALGLPVHVGTINYIYGSTLVTEVLERSAQDVFGGHFIFESDPEKAAAKLLNEIERRRWKLGWSNSYQVETSDQKLTQEQLYRMAIEGGLIATGFADQILSVAIEKYGYQQKIEYPETAYELPSIYAWDGAEVHDLGDLPAVLGRVRGRIREERTYENALAAGEAVMVAAEIIEALKYLDGAKPYEGTDYCGFIPDRVLRQLGLAFVDDTIPGAAVLVGTASDPAKLVKIVRECQSKGMLIIASFDTIKQLKDSGIQMGLDLMLYPVGEFTQVIHGLNFAIRAALSFGGVQRGDRERLAGYMAKRPKVFVLHFGPMDAIKAGAEMAVMLNGSPIIADIDAEGIPDKFISQLDMGKMFQTALEAREIKVSGATIDLPVAFGPAFEGETIRKPETYLEAGGAAKTMAFELLRLRNENEVEDGRITVIGKDIDEMQEGWTTPLAILVDVYGKKMQEDFESVLERRIHLFLNFAEGVWHTGQRNIIWVRISKNAVKSGFKLKHLGDILIGKIKEEFGNIVSRVQVTIVTDGAEVKRHLPGAMESYAKRDARMANLTDEAVDTFYSCLMCQSFAPDHVCIVTPERLGLCGAINWLDAKTGKEIVPSGPNQPIQKGAVIDEAKGQWEGVNNAIRELTRGKIERFNAYTMMDDPMTSCGCFECIVAMTADMQGVIVVNREFGGMTPIGMKFSTLAGNIGGGKQTPGFIGVGRKYLTSRKFISADGGFLRIVWMPKDLKEALRDELNRRAEELGEQGFVDKIADETITTDAQGLMEWMAQVDHPAMRMAPLLS